MDYFLNSYIDEIKSKILDKEINFNNLCSKIKKLKKKNKIIICGNGGSSSIASHVATDICKELKIPAINFSDHNLITCFANDYGFENWTKETLKLFVYPGDLVILISSSGKSKNMLKAARFVKKNNNFLITLTGFNKENPLSKLGDLNIWIDSKIYNFVEMAHHIILVAAVDKLSKKVL